VLKLFPAEQAGGLGMLRALGAPFPDVLFCPTGGITARRRPSISRCQCGLRRRVWVAPQSMLAAGDWAGIEALARDAAGLKKPSLRPQESLAARSFGREDVSMKDLTEKSIAGHILQMSARSPRACFQTLYFLIDLYFRRHWVMPHWPGSVRPAT